ncbi:hypothetical protein ACU686_14160 [Yinghuangia aomiensis]
MPGLVADVDAVTVTAPAVLDSRRRRRAASSSPSPANTPTAMLFAAQAGRAGAAAVLGPGAPRCRRWSSTMSGLRCRRSPSTSWRGCAAG